MKRIVLDTNVLIGSAYNPRSASRRIVEACLRRELTPVVSPAVKAEYERIIPRAVQDEREVERIRELISQAQMVRPAGRPRVVPDDPEDDKFLAAAVAGKADAVITSDDHVLGVGAHWGIPIVRPTEFVEQYLEGCSR